MKLQRNSNSYRSPYRTDFSYLDIMRIPSVNCGRGSSHIFCQNEEGTYQNSACKLLSNLLIIIFCFIASITETISSEVSSPGKGSHHILLFEELSSKKALNWIRYSNLPLTLLIATDGCFNFGSTSFHFFGNKRCLTTCPRLALYPQLYHSHSFPVHE